MANSYPLKSSENKEEVEFLELWHLHSNILKSRVRKATRRLGHVEAQEDLEQEAAIKLLSAIRNKHVDQNDPGFCRNLSTRLQRGFNDIRKYHESQGRNVNNLEFTSMVEGADSEQDETVINFGKFVSSDNTEEDALLAAKLDLLTDELKDDPICLWLFNTFTNPSKDVVLAFKNWDRGPSAANFGKQTFPVTFLSEYSGISLSKLRNSYRKLRIAMIRVFDIERDFSEYPKNIDRENIISFEDEYNKKQLEKAEKESEQRKLMLIRKLKKQLS